MSGGSGYSGLAEDAQLCSFSLQVMLSMKVVFLGVTLVAVCASTNVAIRASMDKVTTSAELNEGLELNATTIQPEEEYTHEDEENSANFRLPGNVKPKHYKLQVLHLLEELENDEFKKFTSPGNVTILVDVLQPCSKIILHSDNLTIHDVQLRQVKDQEKLEVSNYTFNKDVQFLIIETAEILEPDEYEISIRFVTRIADDRLNGLYLDFYVDPKTKTKRYLATTLFAPNHARKAFPCFDEPSLRATFSISIGHDATKFKSLSNMPLQSQSPVEWLANYTWSHFETTPTMSTYIVAMITTDFVERVESKPRSPGKNISLKTYLASYLANFNEERLKGYYHSRKGAWDFYMNMTRPILEKFGEFFGENYSLDKLDVVSLPHFFFNAMENWGLMTFKDPALLDVEGVTTESQRFRITEIVSHELSHQWFGNLVGVDWWSWVWLKEGFSTYFSCVGAHIAHPEFVAWKLFTTKYLQVAMHFDGGFDTHPLENEPKDASAVGEIYTKIPYKKGASILRMTQNFMGTPSFYKAIGLYVQRMKFKAAQEDDLFQAFDDVEKNLTAMEGFFAKNVGVTIKDILKTWTTQSGYPVVTVSLNKDATQIILKQEKFVNPLVVEINPLLGVPSQMNSSWWIPVTMYPSKHGVTDFWMPPGETEMFFDFEDNDRMVLLNPATTGYYRVHYNDSRLWSRLLTNFQHIYYFEAQSQIIDDYFHLAFAGYVPVSSALDLIHKVDGNSDIVVWEALLHNLKPISNLLRGLEEYDDLNKLITDKLRDSMVTLRTVKIENASENKRLFELLHSAMCHYDVDKCRSEAKKYLPKITSSSDIFKIAPEIQKSVLCAMVATSSNWTNVWNMFSEFYFQESFSVLRDRYLAALACVTDSEQLLSLLNWTTNKEMDLHDVDKVALLKHVAKNPLGHKLILKFLHDNFQTLYKKVPRNAEKASVANPVTEGIKAYVPYISKQKEYEDLSTFILEHAEDFSKDKRKWLDKQLDKARLNLRWMEVYSQSVLDWVASQRDQ